MCKVTIDLVSPAGVPVTLEVDKAVFYTHLDVYKRQPVIPAPATHCFSFSRSLPRCALPAT